MHDEASMIEDAQVIHVLSEQLRETNILATRFRLRCIAAEARADELAQRVEDLTRARGASEEDCDHLSITSSETADELDELLGDVHLL